MNAPIRIVRVSVNQEEYEALRLVLKQLDRKIWLAETSGRTLPATLKALHAQWNIVSRIVGDLSHFDR